MAFIQPEILRDDLDIKIAIPVYNEEQVPAVFPRRLMTALNILPQTRKAEAIFDHQSNPIHE